MSDSDDAATKPAGSGSPPPPPPPAPPYHPRPEWTTYLEKGQEPNDEQD